jgi:hypothetical protein
MQSDASGLEGTGHPGEDRLLDLVLGFLPLADESACLAHLRACEECEGRTRALASEHAKFRSMAHASAEREGLAAGEAAEPSDGTGADRSRARRPLLRLPTFRSRWAWAIPLAAAAVVIAVLVRPTGPGPSRGLEPAWLVNPSSILVLNRDQGGPGFDPDLRAGLEAYERRDLEGAIRSLGRVQAQGDLEPVRRVYLGSALARQRRFRGAVKVYRGLHEQEIPELLRAETRWTLFVALSGAGERTSSDSLLALLAREPGAVGDRARAQRKTR